MDQLQDTNIIFTYANADTHGNLINKMIMSYVKTRSARCFAYQSLGQLRYLSVLKHVDAVVGNLSSGLLEAPSLKTATINIGDRQRGRISADSVIHCDPVCEDIADALSYVYTDKFSNIVSKVVNPYGDGGASHKVVDIVKDYPLDGIIKKSFYDLQ